MTAWRPLRGPGLAAPVAASLAVHVAVLGAAVLFAGWYAGRGSDGAALTIEAMPPQFPAAILAAEETLPELQPMPAEPPALREVAEEWALQLYERVPLSPPLTVWSEARPPRERAHESVPAAAAVAAAPPAGPAPATPALAADAAPAALMAPRLLAESCPAPVYPRLAQRRSLEGTVWLLLEVAADGQPVTVLLEQSSGHSILDEAALAAARAWRLAPATRNGAAEAGALRVPVTFRLKTQATGAPE